MLRLLREALDLSQEDVARAAGTSAGMISNYECGQKELTRERLIEIVESLGLAPSEIDKALAFAESVRTGVGPRSRGSEEEDRLVRLEDWGTERTRDYLRTFHARLHREATAAAERRHAVVAWSALQGCDEEERMGLVERSSEYRSWGLVERICAESRRAAARSADEALALAHLALKMARLLPEAEGGELFRRRVEGFALAHVANAVRVGGNQRKAGELFAQAKELWEQGAPGDPSPELLDEARMLSLEVSLLRDQRHLPQALALADQTLALGRKHLAADLLIKKANILELLGKYEAAIATLRRAEPHLEGNREPRSRWLQKYGLMVNLCHVGNPGEAEALLPEVQGLAMERGDALDDLRLQWLRGRIAAGLRRMREAAGLFESVRQAFERLGIVYDMALVSVELAAVYMCEGRTAETKTIARQLLPIFSAQGVSTEVEKALRLFVEAVRQEEATAELARRLVAYLYLARGNPELPFSPKG